MSLETLLRNIITILQSLGVNWEKQTNTASSRDSQTTSDSKNWIYSKNILKLFKKLNWHWENCQIVVNSAEYNC